MLSKSLLTVLLLAAVGRDVSGESYSDYTFKGWVEWSDTVVIARRVKPAKSSPKSGQSVTCEVIQVIKADRPIKRGTKITYTHFKRRPWRPQMATGALLLLLGDRENRDDKKSSLSWEPHANASAGLAKYIREAPSTRIPEAKRLSYFFRFLEHAEPPIAADAFKEFEQLHLWKPVIAFGRTLKPVQLRRWVDDPNTFPKRRWLYAIFLGLCGTPGDAERLKRHISRVPRKYVEGRDGLMTGYLLLAGKKGVDFLDKTKLSRKWLLDDRGWAVLDKHGKKTPFPFYETYNASQALDNLWDRFPERIDRPRLRKSMRLLLDNPELNDLVISTLARWKDWSIQDRLMKLYGAKNYRQPATKLAIVRYMIYSMRATAKGKKADTQARVIEARKYLATLRKKDPKTVRKAERWFFDFDKDDRTTSN